MKNSTLWLNKKLFKAVNGHGAEFAVITKLWFICTVALVGFLILIARYAHG